MIRNMSDVVFKTAMNARFKAAHLERPYVQESLGQALAYIRGAVNVASNPIVEVTNQNEVVITVSSSTFLYTEGESVEKLFELCDPESIGVDSFLDYTGEHTKEFPHGVKAKITYWVKLPDEDVELLKQLGHIESRTVTRTQTSVVCEL